MVRTIRRAEKFGKRDPRSERGEGEAAQGTLLKSSHFAVARPCPTMNAPVRRRKEDHRLHKRRKRETVPSSPHVLLGSLVSNRCPSDPQRRKDDCAVLVARCRKRGSVSQRSSQCAVALQAKVEKMPPMQHRRVLDASEGRTEVDPRGRRRSPVARGPLLLKQRDKEGPSPSADEDRGASPAAVAARKTLEVPNWERVFVRAVFRR